MTQTVLLTLGASAITSLVAFVGVVLLFSRERVRRIAFALTAFAVGALLGDAFMHLIPEASQSLPESIGAGPMIIAGIFIFFVLERMIHVHHMESHGRHAYLHPVVVNNMLSDALHNFVDGVLIAASFLVSPAIGLGTTLAVILHEIPQELGDFGILISKGLSFRRALLFNFLTATTAIIGAIAGLVLLAPLEAALPYALAITAGGFIYIALADLVPDLHLQTIEMPKTTTPIGYTKAALTAFLPMLVGLSLMYLLTFVA